MYSARSHDSGSTYSLKNITVHNIKTKKPVPIKCFQIHLNTAFNLPGYNMFWEISVLTIAFTYNCMEAFICNKILSLFRKCRQCINNGVLVSRNKGSFQRRQYNSRYIESFSIFRF